MIPPTDLFPSIELSFFFDHHPTDSEVLNMAGVTYYFDRDNDVQPSLYFEEGLNGRTSYSIDTVHPNYYVRINSIKFVKKDFTIFNNVDVYLVNGTCSALMEGTDAPVVLKNGSFNFLISRVNEE